MIFDDFKFSKRGVTLDSGLWKTLKKIKNHEQSYLKVVNSEITFMVLGVLYSDNSAGNDSMDKM